MSATELHYPFTDSHGTLHFLTESEASERVTLELVSASNVWGRAVTGWDTIEGREDAVRMLVQEHCT